MDEFYRDWRRRFAIHATLLLAFSVAVGFQYMKVLGHDDPPLCSVPAEQICDPTKEFNPPEIGVEPNQCKHDDPCLPDTVLEHRWRSAHQQGLLHALLLFGFAIAAPHLQVGRSLFNLSATLVIVGVWAAPIGASIMAYGTAFSEPSKIACVIGKDELTVTHCMGVTVGAVAGISTGLAFIIVALRSLWEALRNVIAPSTWKNWLSGIKVRPRRISLPKDVAELREIVDAAIEEKTTVRPFGARYSWSAIAPTDGVMVDMRMLRSIDEPKAVPIGDAGNDPRTTHTVRVEAGATLRDVVRYLRQPGRKLMLQTSTVNPWVQIGGALANGCHGTGVHHKTLVDLVNRIEIIQTVVVDGKPHSVDVAYDRPDPINAAAWKEWRALLVNLGCLGIMHAVTFECAPLHAVHIEDTTFDMRSTIEDSDALREIIGHVPHAPDRYAELFWFPFNDELFVRSWDRTAPGDYKDFSLWFWVRQWLVAKLLGPIIFALVGLLPFLTPFLMRVFHMAFATIDTKLRASDAMQYERFFMPVNDMGYAIGYDPDPALRNGFEAFQKAWFRTVEKLENARHRGHFPQNLILHVRFGKGSPAFLHPSNGHDYVAYMEVVTHVNAARQVEHFQLIESIWHRLEGKAHWGKITYQPDRLIDHYPTGDVSDFLDVRRKVDPAQIFLNDYVRRILREEAP